MQGVREDTNRNNKMTPHVRSEHGDGNTDDDDDDDDYNDIIFSSEST
jgi:hypothetical protein